MVAHNKCKAIMLFLFWVSMGFYSEIPGPTMIDIKILFQASYDEVSRSVSGRGAGGLFGALIGGLLVDRYSHSLDLLIAISGTVGGLAIMFAPYTYSINTLWFHYFALGICNGVIFCAGYRSVITLWPGKTAAAYFQLLQLGYCVGALLVPIVVDPFLAQVEIPEHNDRNKQSVYLKITEETRVHIPFVGVGMFLLLLSVVFYRLHFKTHSFTRYVSESLNKKLTLIEIINPATYVNEQFGLVVNILVVICLYLFILVGGVKIFTQFIRSISLEVFNFSKTNASYLNMTFWLSLTLGRLIGSVISYYVPIRKLFLFQVLMHTFSTSILNAYAFVSPLCLWYCTAAEGFLISPLNPGVIVYGNSLIEISGISLMAIKFAMSFGDLSFTWIAGMLYDLYGPKSVLYMMQLVGIVLFICALVLRIGERHKTARNKKLVVKI